MQSLPEGLHGAYSRLELNRLLTPQGVKAAVRRGWLASFARTVLVDPRRATEFATRAAAALLFAGPAAVLSGPSALVVHGCSAADTAPVHVLVPYHRKPASRPGVIVHHGRFDEQDVQEVSGLRTLAIDAALVDVLCRERPQSAIACADQVLAMVPEGARADLRSLLAERVRARADSRGTVRALALLELATGLAESPAESWLLLGMVDRGLPIPEQQLKVLDIAGNEIYRLDFAWPSAMVAVEYDGYASHENRKDRDAARDADLRRRGWTVIRADASDLTDLSRVVAAVRAAFRAQGLAA
ncbi:DUF559 domain-containing protein [Amycolatopsis taiwanensis]|uniref:DUF559 domain-containing protein n=1 Tax=Amycolatopsis taiwanensis TaxID=342230 RepID=UPI0004890B8F|nr:DUF559 domain-containing protein [Amycolatopsis taiwanensis]